MLKKDKLRIDDPSCATYQVILDLLGPRDRSKRKDSQLQGSSQMSQHQ